MVFVPATQQGGTPQGRREFTSEDAVLTPAASQAGYRLITTAIKEAQDRTMFRILPSFDEDGVMLDGLNPAYQPGASIGTLVGSWAHSVEVVEGLGMPHSMTMITTVKSDNAGNRPPDPRSPAAKCIYNCTWKIKEMEVRLKMGETIESMRAAGQPVQWLKYTKGQWPFSNLKDPYPRWLVQGLCSTWNGHVFRDKTTGQMTARGRFVLMFSNKLFKSFAGAIGQAYDPGQPLTLKNNTFGDFLSPEFGRPILVTKSVTKSDKGKDDVTYGVGIDNHNTLPIPEEQCRKLWQPWERLLHIPTVEESIEQLVKCLGPDMVDFGLKGSAEYPCAYKDYIPDDVAGASRNIPPTVNTKELESRIAGHAGSAPRPQDTPGYPKDADVQGARIAVDLGDSDADQIPFETSTPVVTPTSSKPTPPPFPMDDAEEITVSNTANGEPPVAEAPTSVQVDFGDDSLSGGDFSANLEKLAGRK